MCKMLLVFYYLQGNKVVLEFEIENNQKISD